MKTGLIKYYGFAGLTVLGSVLSIWYAPMLLLGLAGTLGLFICMGLDKTNCEYCGEPKWKHG